MRRRWLVAATLVVAVAAGLVVWLLGDRLDCDTCALPGGEGAAVFGLLATPDGGLVVVGAYEAADPAGPGEGGSFWIARLGARGAVLWERHLGSWGDRAEAVAACADGGVLVAGMTQEGPGGEDVLAVRLDGDGRTTWTNRFGGPEWDVGRAVAATADGGAVVAGLTAQPGGERADASLTRLDATGRLVWERRYGGAGWDEADAVVALPDGGFLVAGETSAAEGAPSHVWLLRLDAQGELPAEAGAEDTRWETVPDGERSGSGSAVVALPDGGAVVAGTDSVPPPAAACEDSWCAVGALTFFDARGRLLRSRHYPCGESAHARALARMPDGGFVLAGTCRADGDTDLWVVRTDADGAVLWEHVVPGTSSDVLNAVVARPDGSVVAGGSTLSTGERRAVLLALDAQGRPVPLGAGAE